eukprot:4594178-Prymnesium_polylepis.1
MRRRAWATAATSAPSVMCTPWCAWYLSLSPRMIVIDASADGSSTVTGWKRRASAASFSICRYSARVVAPTHASWRHGRHRRHRRQTERQGTRPGCS